MPISLHEWPTYHNEHGEQPKRHILVVEEHMTHVDGVGFDSLVAH